MLARGGGRVDLDLAADRLACGVEEAAADRAVRVARIADPLTGDGESLGPFTAMTGTPKREGSFRLTTR
ncbi:MAG: hypothetical protein MI919_07650 [Holophagales bacterium]|nr:hypothetical protein [Holophagales bacterium]